MRQSVSSLTAEGSSRESCDRARVGLLSVGKHVQTIIGARAFLPSRLPTHLRLRGRLASEVADATEAVQRLTLACERFPYKMGLFNLLARAEARASAAIDGSDASLLEILMYEKGLSAAAPTVGIRHSVAYASEFMRGYQCCHSGISLERILDAHRTITCQIGGVSRHSGTIRDKQTWLGSSDGTIFAAAYVPPPPEDVGGLMRDLISFTNGNWDMPRLVQAALSHYQFEAIQPFAEWNGTVSRLLLALTLSSYSLPRMPALVVSESFLRTQSEYEQRFLAVSKTGDIEGWLTYFMRAMANQARLVEYRLRRLHSLYWRYRRCGVTRVGRSRTDTVLVNLLFRAPVINRALLRDVLNASPNISRNLMSGIVAKKMLSTCQRPTKTRVLVANEILEALCSSPLAQKDMNVRTRARRVPRTPKAN